MLRTMLKSKVHRATVTDCDLHYVGSLTVDPELLEAADILPNELVAVVDVNNGRGLRPTRSPVSAAHASSKSTALQLASCTEATP